MFPLTVAWILRAAASAGRRQGQPRKVLHDSGTPEAGITAAAAFAAAAVERCSEGGIEKASTAAVRSTLWVLESMPTSPHIIACLGAPLRGRLFGGGQGADQFRNPPD